MLGGPVLRVSIIPYECVSSMFSCHEHATAGSTDCLTGIVLSELHSLLSQSINVRRLDPFLTKAPEFIISQIIGKDENDIRFAGEAVKSTKRNCQSNYYDFSHIHYDATHSLHCNGSNKFMNFKFYTFFT